MPHRSASTAHREQTTALIHEAYLRLVEGAPRDPDNRCHFVALASHLMRQILVDHRANAWPRVHWPAARSSR